jgi:peptide/nickel transport system ATP-binding protein
LPRPLTCTGSITFEGKELLTPGRSNPFASVRGSGISLLLQDPFTMLNPAMSAGDHIIETLRSTHGRRTPRGAELRAEVARRLLEVGIDNPAVADRYPFELSGGMSQRVALATSLAGDPRLLVADEPTTALDTTTQQEILELLLQVQQRRRMSLVLISHNLNLAFSVCRRLLVMYAGSVVEVAPAAALQTEPLHPYSADLMRSVPSATHYQSVLLDIAGTVPPVDQVLDQCGYASRCAHVREQCRASKPPLLDVAPERSSACVRIEELRNEPRAVDVPAAPDDRAVLAQRPPVLVVEDLHKTYGRGSARHPALRGVSFAVHQSESVGIVGESGSGKTTIAKILLGLEKASAGEVTLGETDISDFSRLPTAQLRATRSAVQCVFQDPYSSLNPLHSIGYALSEALGQRAVPSADRAVEVQALLDRVGLPAGAAERLPSALSGGQRQRVAIARALAVQPQLLICDEPVAALDVSVQAQVLRLLRSVRDEGQVSFLFITHDLAVVRQVADRVIVLCRGEIVEQGETGQVLDHPTHPYTQRLIAAMP